MPQSSIKSLPSRYEPLIGLFGDGAKTTFVKQEDDLREIARLINQIKSAFQGKLQFIYSETESGAGKTTFIHSLELFLPDLVESVIRVINDGGDALDRILTSIRCSSVTERIKVFNLDGHESFIYTDEQYRNFSVQLNNLLRNRRDILVLWPVNDFSFAGKIVSTLKSVGGNSPFGNNPIYRMKGLSSSQFTSVLQGILKIANWHTKYESLEGLQKGLLVDVVTEINYLPCFVEFHHKSEAETVDNKVSIYILEKLKEYAINYRISPP